MADRFLFKTEVPVDALLASPFGTGTAIEDFSKLKEFLNDRVSESVQNLFAEPLISQTLDTNTEGHVTISWYFASDDDVRSLQSLNPQARKATERLLIDMLAELKPFLEDPGFGNLLNAALTIQTSNDIWVIGGNPVLVNWGIMPAGAIGDPAARESHLDSTLGPYLNVTPSADEADSRISPPIGGRSAKTLAPSESGISHIDTGYRMQQEPQPSSVLPTAAWLPPVVLIVLFSIVLLWLLLPGTRLFPQASSRLADNNASLTLVEEANRSLVERLRALEDGLANAVCTADGDLILPADGRMPNGFLPPAAARNTSPDEARIAPSTLVPADPERIAVQQELPEQLPDGPPVSRQETTNLLRLIESQTALVLIDAPNGAGTGSGFFVAPDLLITNFHVIEPALMGDGSIFVTSESIGEILQGEVIAYDGPLETTGRDFALLRVPGAVQPFFTLRSSNETMRLQNVIAAGYPGILLETDSNFSGLLSGEQGSIPALTVTDGIVNVEQDFGPSAMRVVVHTAAISRGNSGGPLVDYCGRAVGINTFGRSADSRQLNFALTSTDLLRFLDEVGAATSSNGLACAAVPINSSSDVGQPDGSAAENLSEGPAEGEAAPSTTPPAQ